ncbi:MAG: hypothetical protein HYY10_00890 [Candidatus Liptonbacteria bacterium]|nr:hypothetical protein [Candidatus Liptonbacteria bacterium]
MDNKSTLKDLGLSDVESGIYLSLLKLGGSEASRIAKDAGIKRTTIYPILQRMAREGFVTVYFRKNKRFYYAQRPHRVAAFFEKKLNAFNSIVATLESVERRQAQTTGLRFIETKEELEGFYAGILKEYKGKEYRIIGSAGGWEGIDPAFFIQYRKDRARAGIATRLLLTADSKEISPTDTKLRRDVRFLPKQYLFKSTIDIYDDKILVVSPDLASLAVVIEIPAMTDIFKSVFEMLWENFPA